LLVELQLVLVANRTAAGLYGDVVLLFRDAPLVLLNDIRPLEGVGHVLTESNVSSSDRRSVLVCEVDPHGVLLLPWLLFVDYQGLVGGPLELVAGK